MKSNISLEDVVKAMEEVAKQGKGEPHPVWVLSPYMYEFIFGNLGYFCEGMRLYEREEEEK